MNKRIKLFNTKPTSTDDDAKTITFSISDNQEDRYGEIVDQKSWDLKNYLLNPIVLWGHDPDEPENVLGTALSIQAADDGSHTEATLKFDTDINPNANLVYNQLKRGTLRTVSIGFMPHTLEYEDDTPVLKDNELLEISVVPIPANPRAVALALKAGEIHAKDARWLMDGMRKEADFVEMQLQIIEPKEKSMTEEQVKELLEGIASLKTAVEAIQEDNKTLHAEIAELKPVETPEPENTDDTTDEPDPAKGGEDDQPGAGDDEFGDDTELTPEQEAEMDAQLQDQLAAIDEAA